MKKKIIVNYFSQSKKWPRRIPNVKKITTKTLKIMNGIFDQNSSYFINLVLSDKSKLKNLNKKYKNKHSDTNVLTFVSLNYNKNLGKILYCDIFFSIDKIEEFIKKYNEDIYEHFNHLLIHSLLHINGYDHIKKDDFRKMKYQEIKILKKIGIKNPYII